MSIPQTTGRALSILIHSDTKVGKSTFAATCPKPMLLLDAEAAHRFLPGRKVFWDPTTEAPPAYDGTWEIMVVIVRTYQHFVKAYEWLNAGAVQVLSVAIDSISEIQTKLRDDLSQAAKMDRDVWGNILIQMERLCRGFRDLTEHPTRPMQAVVLTAMTQQKDGKWRPYLQGQAQVKTPYYFDICGYLYVEAIPDPNDATQPMTKVRRMLVVPHPQYEAGERVQGRLGEVVDNPTVPTMLDAVFGPANQEGATV